MDALENNNITPVMLIDEQVRILYKGIPLSLAVTIILDLLLSISHWNIIGQGEIILWNILMLCAAILRTAHWFFWRNAQHNVNPRYWLNSFRIGVCIAGAAWGSASYFMFANLNPTYQALLAFTLAGVASGSLTSLAIDKFSVLAFVILAIAPLSIRLHFEHGPIAIPMSLMVAIFIIFVLTAARRARKQLENSLEKNAQLIAWGNERIHQQRLEKIITHIQGLFIEEKEERYVFEQLLEQILDFTDSRFGFIGEVLHDDQKNPYLTMFALSNIAWDKKSRAAYTEHLHHGMKFRNLNTLFGAALITGRPIISNTPAQDMRAAGTPNGHPPLSAFLGIPIYSGGQQVGVLGLANCEKGYSETDVKTLHPILNLISQIMIAIGHKRQHKIDEENIKHHANHTQAILEGAFDAILTINQSGLVTSFNQAAEIIFGYRQEQIIGENIRKIIPASFQHTTQNADANQNLKNILGIGHEMKGVRRNGKEFEMEMALSEITSNGKTTYIGVVRDISERKRTEKMKNEFIATVSHELRTPLTSITASLAIIESGTLGSMPDKVQNLIKIARQNSFRLQNLINDLLDMEKLLVNKIEFDLKNFDATKLVQTTIESNQYLIEKYHVTFQISSAEKNCIIYADELRTQQVLNHLFSNAAKFSPARSVVDISIAHNNSYIRIVVTDYGAGILPEFQTEIFRSFTQADSSSSRHREGSGLGLTISKELIEKMGGKIGFTSNPGQGSSFYIELPDEKLN